MIARLLKLLITLNLVIPFLFLFVPAGLGPEGDALDYRLWLIDWALRTRSYPNLMSSYVDDFPMLAEMLMAVARSVVWWGPRLVSAAAYLFFVLGAYRLGRLLLPKSPVLTALGTVLIASSNVLVVQDNLIMVDNFASAMLLWAVYYALKYLRQGEMRRHFVKSALFAGLALATRYTQIPFVLALGFSMGLLTLRPMVFVGYCSMAFACLLPWMVRNTVLNHNPVYPLFTNIIGGKFFSSLRHQEVFGMVSSLRGFGRSPLGFLLLPFRFAFFRSAFDYSVGPQFLMFMPWIGLSWAVKWPRGKVRVSQWLRTFDLETIAFALLTVWFIVCQEGRFVVPVLPLFLFMGLAGVEHWMTHWVSGGKPFEHWLRQGFVAFLVAFSVIGTAKHAHKHKTEFQDMIARVKNPEAPWTSVSIRQQETANWINQNLPGEKILLLHRTGNLSEIKNEIVFGYPHVYSTSQYDHRSYPDARSFYQALETAGINILYLSMRGGLHVLPEVQGTGYQWQDLTNEGILFRLVKKAGAGS